ncbi:hypothetical protein [Nocardioides sp. CER19]|uniref:hypothetical protein n=1 Tax=Nocardioides sp. CER19 TaxID=3038538 RepID=UPI002448A9B2|nr:hypothetical protein [Nocardioides sp. CER19]MDH2415351.1 hypothetical protein [Nocardioides sp. CER19]
MRRGTARVAAAVLVCGITLAGCSGGSDDKPTGGRSTSAASPSATTAPAAPEATVATVTGRLDGARRVALAQAVGTVVGRWLDGAYLGRFPRTDYSAAFAGFTAGAAAKAHRDLALMSNAAISSRIDTATATKRVISLDVLSLDQRPVGVTATVRLAFDTTGTLTGSQQVAGTVDLTPVGNGWKIFGYEIARTPA